MNKKKIYLLLIVITISISLVFGLTFAFISTNTTLANTEVLFSVSTGTIQANLVSISINPNVNVVVNESNLFAESIGQEMTNSPITMNFNLSSNVPMTCTYDLIWKWDSDSSHYTKSSSSSNELVVTGTDISGEVQLNNWSSNTTLATNSSIELTASGSVSKNYIFYLKFYNLNVNQDAHAGKNYKGKVVATNVDCSRDGTPSVTTLSQTIIDDVGSYTYYSVVNEDGYRYEGEDPNNYVEIGDDLYRIIGAFDGSSINLTSGEYYTKLISASYYETDSDFYIEPTIDSSVGVDCSMYPDDPSCMGGSGVDCSMYPDDPSCTGSSGMGGASQTVYGAQYWDENGWDNYFSDTSLYTYINGTFKTNYLTSAISYMVNARWYYGSIPVISLPSEAYDDERTGSYYTTGYVGLMNLSDYLYAVLPSDCPRNTYFSTYSTCIDNYGSSKNWLTVLPATYPELTMTQFDYTDNPPAIIYGGNAGIYGELYTQSIDGVWGLIRPTFYLNSNVIVTGGNGSISNPFTISMPS